MHVKIHYDVKKDQFFGHWIRLNLRLKKRRGNNYRVDRILPQIFTTSASANMKHTLKEMQYRFAVIYETLSRNYLGLVTTRTGLINKDH